MTDEPTWLLVHGAFRGGWAWEPVVEELAERGLHAVAPDLPNAGDKYRQDHPVTGLADAVDAVADVARPILGPIVLVGHSQGSLVVRACLADPRFAGTSPDDLQVVQVCHLDGAVPRTGEAAVDLGPGGPRPPPNLLVTPPGPDPGLPAGIRRLVATRVRPQHAAIALEPVGPILREVPTSCAFCSLTPPTFPSSAVRGRLTEAGEPYRVLEGPHDLPLVAPGVVVDWLLDSVDQRSL